jgi:hypothetical protein
MNVIAIADRLRGLGYTNVFAYNMPGDIKNGILVVSWMPAEIHPDIWGYKIGEFTVVVRDPDYKDGLLISNKIKQELTVENEVWSDWKILFSRAKHDPMVFPRSEGNGLEFSVNFQCRFID